MGWILLTRKMRQCFFVTWCPTGNDRAETALIKAAAAGHERVVEALCDAGADTNAVDDRGRSALIHAAAAGHVSAGDFDAHSRMHGTSKPVK
jgi:hypothetical protein